MRHAVGECAYLSFSACVYTSVRERLFLSFTPLFAHTSAPICLTDKDEDYEDDEVVGQGRRRFVVVAIASLSSWPR